MKELIIVFYLLLNVHLLMGQYDTGNGDGHGSATVNDAVLPVEFVYFRVHLSGNNAVLEWQTASEINNDHFQIQRSTDGVDFDAIGKVDGFGNSDQLVDYEFLDRDPYDDISFYRLKQIDVDGKSEFSPMVVLHIPRTSLESVFNVFPNPIHDQLFVQFTSKSLESRQLKFHNLSGQVVQVRKFMARPGNNLVQFQVSSIPDGIYIITIEGVASSRKIIKSDQK